MQLFFLSFLRCWFNSSSVALLWLLKATKFPSPTRGDLDREQLLREFWDLNGIRYDPVLDPVPLMKIFIARFGLGQEYLTDQQSCEELFFHMFGQLQYFAGFVSHHIQITTFGPCNCIHAEWENVHNPIPFPIINIGWGHIKPTVKESVENIFVDEVIDGSRCDICKSDRLARRCVRFADFPSGFVVQVSHQINPLNAADIR